MENIKKQLKKVSVSALCKMGRYGVGKSVAFGMFDFDIPKECREYSEERNVAKMKNRRE